MTFLFNPAAGTIFFRKELKLAVSQQGVDKGQHESFEN